MLGGRLLYLAVLVFCGVFYIAYGEWLSFLVLMAVLGLPWLSLLLSIPAILSFRVIPAGPEALEMGQRPELWLLGSCPQPMPPFRGQLKLVHTPSGRSAPYQDTDGSLTDHCGCVTVTAEKVRICDYLGLFAFPVKNKETKTILIHPRPLAVNAPKELERHIAGSWKPKSGGGFAENHELRPYRPGDNLNQIHWKLSAKTGDLILRQSMEPQRGLVLLTLHLRGTPEEVDRKFGRLMWLGRYLLEKHLTFELRALTGSGLLTFSIAEEAGLDRAIHALLRETPMTEGDLHTQTGAVWQYHIGGEPDEA